MQNQRGALHLVGIFFILLLIGVLYVISSWSREVTDLRSHVGALSQKVEMLDLRLKNLEGRVGP